MRRVRWMLLVLSLAAATVTGVGTGTASAHEDNPTNESDATLPDAAGPAQRPPGAIPLAPGVDLLPPPADAGVMHDGHIPPDRGCPYYHLCVFHDADFTGGGLGFYYCGLRDLSVWGFPPHTHGGVSSVINNQTAGTWSYFYDSSMNYLFFSLAPNNISNLNDRGSNDLARYVRVC